MESSNVVYNRKPYLASNFLSLYLGGTMNCDNCLLRKVMFNEHGRHAVCSLSLDKARECKNGEKKHYISIKKEENPDE